METKLPEISVQDRSLLDKIQAAVVVHSADTKIIASNNKAHELLGLTEDQMLGKTAIDPYWQFIDADNDALPLELYPVNLVLAKRKALKDYIVGILRPDREDTVWVLVNAEPDFSGGEEVTQVVVTFMDITERKRMAEELQKSHDRLEERVEARTAELRAALEDLETLNGLLPICASCKDIRDDQGYWNQIESYISKHSRAQFSHGICPSCAEKLLKKIDS